MSRDDDARWQAIADAEALGEPLSADDAAFRRDYEATHPECADESEAWGALLSALGAPAAGEDLDGARDDGDADDDLAASIVAAYRSDRGVGSTTAAAEDHKSDETGSTAGDVVELRPRSRPSWPRVAAGLAIAASLALVVLSRTGGVTSEEDAPAGPKQAKVETPERAPGERAEPPQTPRTPETPAPPRTTDEALIALTSPAGVTLNGAPAYAGALLTEGATITSGAETCLVFQSPFASVCLSPGSEASLTTASGGDRSLTLRRGALVATLDKLPEGHAFTVRTADGAAARAVGTVFAVRVAGDAPDVGVLEGAIEVRPRPDAAPRGLRAGEHTTFADGGDPAPLPSDLRTWSERHMKMAGLWRGLEGAALVNLAATPADLAIDGYPLIDGELALLVAPGEHRLEIAGDRGARATTLAGDPAAPTTMGAAELRPPTKPKASRAAPPTPAGPSIAELRQRASDARASRSWRAAADAYRELLDDHPTAPEAHNARYQLGDLLRRRLGQPASALAHFDAYLERGGPLAAEARFGKVLALQQLGRRGEEAAAIADFLEHHPRHIEADKLRQRASELRPAP
jgi:ferric-dicitrate binding protein FerR (iron transport regulator)